MIQVALSWSQLQKKQPYAVALLLKSIQKQRLSHAYLFEGNRGTGKMAVAKQLAKTLFCLEKKESFEPCQRCVNCKRIDSHNHPDVRIFSPEEGKQITIDKIDFLLKEIAYRGSESKQRLFVIEHADRMTQVAANRLLKFIEEPSEKEIVILVTEQLQKILPTILSRCQTISFKPQKRSEISEKLEKNGISKPLARLVSTLTDDSDKAFELSNDEIIAQAQSLVIQLSEDVLNKRSDILLVIQEKVISRFKDKEQINLLLDLFLLWFRDVIFLHLQKDDQLVFIHEKNRLEKFLLHYSIEKAAVQMETILEAKKRLDANVSPQLVIEQVVLSLQEGLMDGYV